MDSGMRPLELGIRTDTPCTLMCGPLSWGYGLTIRMPLQDMKLNLCTTVLAKADHARYVAKPTPNE